MGRTVVSTSRTPGHTKHFQTIYLAQNVRLCDSPGLVFPSLLPKPLQILSGMYPIAQVQEPYSVVQYLAERVNIPRLLKLDPPPTYERGPFRWSAFGICESFGLQRGFLTAKTGNPDVDLVAPNTLFAWKQYFKEQFPELHMASFSCYPSDPTLINDSSTAALQRVVKKPRQRFYNAVGVRDVLVACKEVEVSKNGDQVDWDALIAQHDAGNEKEYQEDDDTSDQDRSSNDDDDEAEGHNPKERVNLLEKQNEADLAKTLQTVHIEDDEHVPHKDHVTIGLV
ncbi:Ferrous iron transport protein B, partial [Entomortierella beljakovae]